MQAKAGTLQSPAAACGGNALNFFSNFN